MCDFSIHAAWEGGCHLSPTSESPCVEHTKHAARGAGVQVCGLIVPYGIFFFELVCPNLRESLRQQTRQLLKASSAKVNP